MAGPDCAVRLRVVVRAQIDPEPRKIVQIGYNQPLEGRGPAGGLRLPLLEHPGLPVTNRTLRLRSRRLTSTANSVSASASASRRTSRWASRAAASRIPSARCAAEKFIQGESFAGHGGEGSVSIYHRVNPSQEIPLNLILRGVVRYSAYVHEGRYRPGVSSA